MQPYEIRQRRDGAIDYNNYFARPVWHGRRDMYRFCRQALSLKTLLLTSITIAALVLAASQTTHRTACTSCAPQIMNGSAQS